MEDEKKCKRGGCNKKYKESENSAEACKFHPGKPIFHDLKKGWTCCNKIVHDWDDFEKIEKCATGQHSDVDPNAGEKGQDAFFKSSTVTNAKNAQDKFEKKEDIKIKKISDFNKQEVKKQEDIQKSQAEVEKKPLVFENGQHKCTSKGCQKKYNPEENNGESCNFHPGEPIFHDLKKYWTCCKKETYDWDDFMKLPTCSKGLHVPKME